MTISEYYKSQPEPQRFGLGDLIGTVKMGADIVTQNWPAVAMDAANGIARWSNNKTVKDAAGALEKFNLWKMGQATPAPDTFMSPQGFNFPGLMPPLNPFGG